MSGYFSPLNYKPDRYELCKILPNDHCVVVVTGDPAYLDFQEKVEGWAKKYHPSKIEHAERGSYDVDEGSEYPRYIFRMEFPAEQKSKIEAAINPTNIKRTFGRYVYDVRLQWPSDELYKIGVTRREDSEVPLQEFSARVREIAFSHLLNPQVSRREDKVIIKSPHHEHLPDLILALQKERFPISVASPGFREIILVASDSERRIERGRKRAIDAAPVWGGGWGV